MLRPLDDLDDAAGIADVLVAGFLDAHEDLVADAGGFRRLHLARRVNANLRRGAVRVFVPFVGNGDEVAVAVARQDVGQHGGGEGAGMMQFLALALDRAFVGEVAQHALQLGAHLILEIEGAGDFAGADLARCAGDEGENLGPGRDSGRVFGRFVQKGVPAPMRRLLIGM